MRLSILAAEQNETGVVALPYREFWGERPSAWGGERVQGRAWGGGGYDIEVLKMHRRNEPRYRGTALKRDRKKE